MNGWVKRVERLGHLPCRRCTGVELGTGRIAAVEAGPDGPELDVEICLEPSGSVQLPAGTVNSPDFGGQQSKSRHASVQPTVVSVVG